MKVRLIMATSKTDMSKERVIFTMDFDDPAEDYVMSDMQITYDKIINADLPIEFPTGSTLIVEQ